jgi:hypothetical protein
MALFKIGESTSLEEVAEDLGLVVKGEKFLYTKSGCFVDKISLNTLCISDEEGFKHLLAIAKQLRYLTRITSETYPIIT